MSLTAHEKFHLKKFVKELESYRAAHTEFVTVYVPAGYDLIKIMQHLQQEQGTASNIKSTSTRNNVIDALERMIQHLRIVGKTPPNGLAVFSGNIASREGRSDVRVWSVEPPVPLKMRLYKCEKTFDVDVIREMMETKEAYGLVVIDSRDAIVALLKGKSIIPLMKAHSHVPGKFKAGGQSAMRFQRNREIAVKEHFGKVAEVIKDQFFTMEGLKGIIVGGPGHTKYEFVDSGLITADIKKKILGIKDLSYTEEFGLQELVDKSQDILAQEEIADEKKIVNQFLELLATKPNIVAYGEAEVKRVLDAGVVDTLLLSESLPDEKIDEFEDLAKKYKSTVKIISVETREGAQLKDLGKYGAILRYEAGY
jgi:peptide chain release factor subunit 1